MCFLFILSVEFDQCLSNCSRFPPPPPTSKQKPFSASVYRITFERLKCWEPIQMQLVPYVSSLLPSKTGLGVSDAATKGNLKTDFGCGDSYGMCPLWRRRGLGI